MAKMTLERLEEIASDVSEGWTSGVSTEEWLSVLALARQALWLEASSGDFRLSAQAVPAIPDLTLALRALESESRPQSQGLGALLEHLHDIGCRIVTPDGDKFPLLDSTVEEMAAQTGWRKP